MTLVEPDGIGIVSKTITKSDAEYALDIVKTICSKIGPGLPGSPQERQRADLIRMELESHLGAENVVAEEFTVAPNACLSSYSIGGISMILAALVYVSAGRLAGTLLWVAAISTLALSIVPSLLFLAEFVFSFEVVDSFFGKRQSVNVIGTLPRPGTTVAKRLLIVSGHHDSAWENNWLRLPGYGFFLATATWVAGLFAMPAMAVVQLTGVVMGAAGLVQVGTLSGVLLAYPVLSSAVLMLFFITGRKNGGNVPGAADNLSACGVVVAACRFLAENPEYVPADTEIRFVTFGSEEAGLRGSRRYVERHREELKRLDARLLNLEIVADTEIGILTSEINGSVKNSPDMVKSVVAAAVRTGVPYKTKPALLGEAGDAGPFSRAGFKATTLLCFRMPEQMLAFYHQKRDRPEVLTLEPLSNVLKVGLEWIKSGGE